MRDWRKDLWNEVSKRAMKEIIFLLICNIETGRFSTYKNSNRQLSKQYCKVTVIKVYFLFCCYCFLLMCLPLPEWLCGWLTLTVSQPVERRKVKDASSGWPWLCNVIYFDLALAPWTVLYYKLDCAMTIPLFATMLAWLGLNVYDVTVCIVTSLLCSSFHYYCPHHTASK